MAAKSIYITVRLDVENNKTEAITDEQIQEIVSEVDYEFKNYEDYEISSEICGINE